MERLGRTTSPTVRLRRAHLRQGLWLLAAAVQLTAACGSSKLDDAPGTVSPTGGTGGELEAGTSAGGAAVSETPAGGMSGAPTGGTGGGATETPTAGAANGGESGAADAASNAGAGGAPDVTFVPAAHPPFPSVTAHGGPVLENIELVPVYFPGDPLQADLESFNTWVVSSNYWKTIGADYGVLTGTRLPAAQITTAPPATMTDVQIATWLAARIADGTLPKPSAQTMFALFYPATTTITSGGAASCTASGFAGLHESVAISNSVFTGNVPFAIIPRCSFSPGDELEIATDVASHEYVEAATSPLVASDPGWYMDGKNGQQLEAWQMLNGLEVSDLCENQSYDVVEGFTVQDSWSNSAAQAGNNPCQPSDPAHPFFMTSADATIYHAQPGATVIVHARAWSNMPAPDWSLGVNWGYLPDSNFDGKAVLSSTTVNNGDDVTATVTIPASPPMVGERSVYRFTIDSIDPINPNFYHPWPVMIVVP